MAICLHNGTLLSGFSSMENCSVLIENGLIDDVFTEKRFNQKQFNSSTKIIDLKGAFIAPGFIDTHIHGFGGFGTDDCDTDSILEMSKILAEYGVSAFNPTIYPAEEDLMLKTIKAVSSAIGKESGAKIMGLHLEGPFISPLKLGVQKPETVKAVDISFMEKLWQASGGHIINMTVAPELKGMRELALFCLKKGIVLQAGHTDAQYENMTEGMQAGILHSTHLFNAMSRLNHRNPNAAGAVLIHPEMACEIIADGVHVHPDLIKLLQRDKPLDKIVLITDALKPTEQKTGPFFANGEEVIFEQGCWHRKVDGVIAGSALTMIKGVKNLNDFGFSLSDSVRFASANPAQIMKYSNQGVIMPGKAADVTVFDQNFEVKLSIINGEIKKNSL